MSCRHFLRLRDSLHRLSGTFSRRLSVRNSSSDAKDDKYYEPCVVDNPSAGYFVCWHPRQPLKYEHTRPITEEMERDTGVLNEVDLKLLRNSAPNDQMIAELKSLTFTTKHIWYPKSEQRIRKPIRARKYM